MSAPDLLAAALRLAALGWPVFPIQAGAKAPYKEEGFFEHGVKDASTDPDRVRAFWRRWPRANVGLAPGQDVGFFVVDVDADERKGKVGHRTIADLEARHGPLPPTWSQTTPTGGWHLLFRHPGWAIGNSRKHVRERMPDCDTRDDGGYIVVAPSVRPEGAYAWRPGCAPWECPLADAPPWLLALFREPAPEERKAANAVRPPDPSVRVAAYVRAAIEAECKRVMGAAKGTGNNTLNAAAFALGTLVGGGVLPREYAEQHLMAAAAMRYGGDFGELRAASRTIRSGLDAGVAKPRAVPAPQERESRPAATPRPARRARSGPFAGDEPAQPRARAQDLGTAMTVALDLWHRADRRLAGTPAGAFVERVGGDPRADWATLRAAEVECWHVPDGAAPVSLGVHPAIVAAMTTPRGTGRRVEGVHLVWLDATGRPATLYDPETGEVVPPRRSIGTTDGAAMRLAPLSGDQLIVTAGLAMAIRAQAAVPELPVWAADGLAGLDRLVLPDAVRRVTLFGVDRAPSPVLRRIARALGAGGRAVHRATTRPGRAPPGGAIEPACPAPTGPGADPSPSPQR